MSSAAGGSLSEVNMLGFVILPYFIETFDQTEIAVIIDEIKDGCSFWL